MFWFMDCTINLWRTDEFDVEGDLVSVKKRKVNNEAEESQAEVLHLSYSLKGHLDLQGIEILPFRLSRKKLCPVEITIKLSKRMAFICYPGLFVTGEPILKDDLYTTHHSRTFISHNFKYIEKCGEMLSKVLTFLLQEVLPFPTCLLFSDLSTTESQVALDAKGHPKAGLNEMRANVAMPLLYNLPVKKIIDAYVILFEIDPHYEYNIYFMGEAVSTIVGHTQCVSSVIWPQHETIYSASWDHSVRRWDVETGKDSWNLVSENDLILPFFYFVCMVKANDVSCG
ncbi:Ribosome biogenesis protein WDR12-like [Vitis vinifera]|uniref:Ribosome biogenesis protein WDR12-like n=1 Tax=Vitis vinifera TaxID=29760 RepID=A0A438HED5_VITVI|nr:Ribosome biogenesis protein WDR12-like [Vitis vinifera]